MFIMTMCKTTILDCCSNLMDNKQAHWHAWWGVGMYQLHSDGIHGIKEWCMNAVVTLCRVGCAPCISQYVRDWKNGGVVNACNPMASKLVMCLEMFHCLWVLLVSRQTKCALGFVHILPKLVFFKPFEYK